MALLKTVRAKLTTLVGLSALATLITLPLLSWVMSRQLVDVVDDRVPEAVRGFDLELADDIHDLEAATRSLADSDEIVAALAKHDENAARTELAVFHEAYPGIGLVVVGPDRKPLATVGLPAYDPGDVNGAGDGIPRAGLGDAAEVRTLRRNGCSVSPTPRPAYSLMRDARKQGFVVACATLDERYLANSAEKLGVELAILDEKGGGASIHTPAFPLGALAQSTGKNEEIVEDGAKTWAIKPFVPKLLQDSDRKLTVVAALDVTRFRDLVRHNLLMTVGVLLAAAIVAIILGARLASMMSRALGRVNSALKKLEQAEYVKVVPVRTGDEMEDLATGFNTMVDGLQERDKLRTTFGKYMTHAVMDHLMKGKVQLGGESLPVTILFTDIRSFTTISEKMSAQELVELLNEYFTEMVTIVIEEDGVVDKYIGDAIMAVFGAPVPKPDDPVRAVRAAVRMRKALAALNERLAERGKPPIMTGIGLHTGEVVAGNIGSEARMEYTVIGDAVNLASRLESSTKELGVNVLISEDTKKLIGDAFETRPVKEITVKGRAAPVMTYEVLGEKAPASAEGGGLD